MYTDEYDIYHRLPQWGYPHETVNHSAGEYARDDDGDGFHEVHVNTMEGFWSLLRSWLRPSHFSGPTRSRRGDEFIAPGFSAYETCRRQGCDLWNFMHRAVVAFIDKTPLPACCLGRFPPGRHDGRIGWSVQPSRLRRSGRGMPTP
jgi:hypothetical protein